MLFDPYTSVDEGLDPRCYIVGLVVGGVCGALPREYGALWVRHDSYVSAVGGGHAGYIVGAAVWVGGVSVVAVACYDVVL